MEYDRTEVNKEMLFPVAVLSDAATNFAPAFRVGLNCGGMQKRVIDSESNQVNHHENADITTSTIHREHELVRYDHDL